MGYSPPSLTSADVLAAITIDSTKFAGANIDAAISSATRLTTLVYWSAPDQLTITTTQTTRSMNSVTLPNLSYSIVAAYIMAHISTSLDTSGATNYFPDSSTIQCQKSGGSWTTGINLDEQILRCGANSQVNDIFFKGDVDVSSQIDAMNQVISFQWVNTKSQGNNIGIYGLKSGILIVVE